MRKELSEKLDIICSEYGLSKENKDVGRSSRRREDGQVKQLKRSIAYKGKTINVTLEFSTVHSNAEQEFEKLLKKMYMDKAKSVLDKKT